MNFQQLRIIREALRHNFNLTAVADALNTSQSGVSKHIKDLEAELGVEFFVRRGKRLLGLTEPGRELAAIVERMLVDAGNLRSLADQFTRKDHGELTIATTHTQARYALPSVISRFRAEYPDVRLILHQASPTDIAAMVQDGRADIGIATEALSAVPDLAAFPYYSWFHAVVTPKDHPLARAEALSLAMIADYPIITYHSGYTGRPRIDRAFARAGLTPDIVMTALDADVIKSYVEIGLGIGIIGSMAFEPERDSKLALLPCEHLFERNTSQIAVRRGRFLRGFACRFVNLCAPDVSEATVRKVTAPTE